MSDEVKTFAEFSQTVAQATEDCLSAWTFAENYQFPVLISHVATKIQKDAAVIDPFVRRYVNMSTRYKACRGVKGGVMRMSDYAKRQQAKTEKADAKKQVAAEIAKRVGDTVTDTTVAVDTEVAST